MEDKKYFVYIVANPSDKVLYIGVTSDLLGRVVQHREGRIPGFTTKYGCCKLVYFEDTTDVYSAIEREKQLKKWRREKKIWLIERTNPKWTDLSFVIGL